MIRFAIFVAFVAGGAAALTGCKLASRSCTLLFMPDQASMSRTLARKPAVDSAVTVESCRNGTCATERLVRKANAWEPEAGGFCSDTSTGGVGRACPITDQDGKLQVHWMLNGQDPKNGDRFRVKAVEEKTSAVLLEEEVTATYTEQEPNGEGCGVSKTATL